MLNKKDVDYLKKQIPKWRKDPALFVKQVWKIDPTEQQSRLLREIAKPGAKVAAKSGHGIGKTTVFAWAIIWFLTCYKDAKIPVTAPTAAQLSDGLWADLKMWHSNMPEQMSCWFTWNSDHFTAETGSFAVARTSRKENPEALQGFHAKNILFLIDEASGVPEEVFTVARGALSTENARVAMAANPTRLNGYFYNAFNISRASYTALLTFSGEESPRVSKQYIQDIVNEYGKDSDMFRVRVAGEFPNASENQFISKSLVDAAILRKFQNKEEYAGSPVIIGVDPAYDGNDEFAIYLRQGLYSKLLYHGLKNDDTIKSAERIAAFEDQYKANAVFIDYGYGTGIKDYGNTQMGRHWVLIKFGEKALTEGYALRRDEIWGLMKEWLKEGGSIENDQVLISDLTGPEAYVNIRGDIKLESKADMKHRGLASPNRGDALALTFALPVKIDRAIAFTKRKNVCNTDYNPFN